MSFSIIKKYLAVTVYSWCLIFSGLPTLGYSQPTTNDKPMTAAECVTGPDSPYVWNGNLNRCLLKADATAQRKMFEQCDALPADQKAACFEKMRNQNLQDEAVSNCKTRHGNDSEALKNCLSAIDGSSSGMQSSYDEKAGLQILGATIGTTVAALAVANMLSKSGKKAKGCTSATMLKVTGIGSLVGQLYLKFGVKGNFDDLEKNYDDQVAAGDDAQFAAYDYLEAEQKEIESVAKKHEKIYNLTALGYGATGVIAGIEMMGGIAGGLKPCLGESNSQKEKTKEKKTSNKEEEDKPEDVSEDKIDEPGSKNGNCNEGMISENDENFFSKYVDNSSGATSFKDIITSAAGEMPIGDFFRQEGLSFVGTPQGEPDWSKIESDMGIKNSMRGSGCMLDEVVVTADRLQPEGTENLPAEAKKDGFFKKLSNFLKTSPGILTLSIAGTLIYTFLKNKASNQGDKANANAKKVADLRETLKKALASSSYCPSRDDLSRPRCYCLQADGSRNTSRTKSETCQALFANLDRSLFADANDYGKNGLKKPQGCFRIDGVYDQECKCKTVKNEKGDDGCFKVPVNVNQIAALGPNTGLPQVVDSMNTLFGGGLGSGQLQSGSINQLAARVGAARKQVLNNLSAKTGLPSSAFKAQSLEILKDLSKVIPKRELANASSQLASSNVSAPASLANNPAIQKALEKSGIVLSSVNRGSGRKANSKSKKKTGFDLYGSDKKTVASAEGVMAKKYDYSEAQDDIVDRKDVSIWQVISNRYTTSGLRRLFDDDSEGL